MQKHLRQVVDRFFKPTVPPVVGVADAGWYDAAYRAIDSYKDQYWHSHYYFLWCVLADRIRRAGVKHVLDIGCGPGQFANCLFDLAGIESYTGLDFSAQAIRMAEQACPRGRFVVDDAITSTIYADARYDVIVCTEVLEHVPADHDVLARFSGRCLCTVPNFPYDSHVRHFTSAAEVSERYGRHFRELDVWGLRGYGSKDNVYFLMDGICA